MLYSITYGLSKISLFDWLLEYVIKPCLIWLCLNSNNLNYKNYFKSTCFQRIWHFKDFLSNLWSVIRSMFSSYLFVAMSNSRCTRMHFLNLSDLHQNSKDSTRLVYETNQSIPSKIDLAGFLPKLIIELMYGLI